MHYALLGRRYDRNNKVGTPADLADALFDLLYPIVAPKVVLDPCVGHGNLIYPWYGKCVTVGVDLDNTRPHCVDHFAKYPFELFTTWEFPKPDLVICNPPFNGGERAMMWPERFLRSIVDLFGREQPTVMIVPHGFRFNQTSKSKRRQWFQCGSGPEITSIISLPLDTFPGVKFHCEILIFNINGLKPHYWL